MASSEVPYQALFPMTLKAQLPLVKGQTVGVHMVVIAGVQFNASSMTIGRHGDSGRWDIIANGNRDRASVVVCIEAAIISIGSALASVRTRQN